MTERYKIVLKFIKDISSETPDIQTYLHVKDKLTKYKLILMIKALFSKKFGLLNITGGQEL